MKKVFTLIFSTVVFILVFSATSCVRKYTCKCTITSTGSPGLPQTSERDYSIKDTQKGAKSKCQENSSTTTQNGITTVEECDIF